MRPRHAPLLPERFQRVRGGDDAGLALMPSEIRILPLLPPARSSGGSGDWAAARSLTPQVLPSSQRFRKRLAWATMRSQFSKPCHMPASVRGWRPGETALRHCAFLSRASKAANVGHHCLTRESALRTRTTGMPTRSAPAMSACRSSPTIHTVA